MTTKKVTLYIPVYNAEQYLDIVIPAVSGQIYPIEEILVINDGSTDHSVEIIKKYVKDSSYPIKIIHHKGNKGLAASRNMAVKNCKTEFIASVDADVELTPDWLEHIMKEFTDENIAGVGGCLVEKFTDTPTDKWRGYYMGQCWGTKKIEHVEYLYGSNNCFKKEVIIQAGFYDERSRTNGEDCYISKNIIALGKRLVYTPDAKCFHLKQDTIKSVIVTLWQWQHGGNNSFPTLLKTLYYNVFNIFTYFRHVAGYILYKRFSFANLCIDIQSLLYCCFLDWKLYFDHRRKPKGGEN